MMIINLMSLDLDESIEKALLEFGIEQYKNNTDAASKYLVEVKKERLFTLEKDEMIFNSLLDCLYNL